MSWIFLLLIVLLPLYFFKNKFFKKEKEKKKTNGFSTLVHPGKSKSQISEIEELDIFNICPKLKEELHSIYSQKTTVYILLFKRNSDFNNILYLKCDWLKCNIPLEYYKNNKIELPYNITDTLNKSESYHKITLISDKKKIDFSIHILLHQQNFFNLYIDKIDKEKTFSLEAVFYSEYHNKLVIKKKTSDVNKNKLVLENYEKENFMRCNYINITQSDLEEIMDNYGKKLNKEILLKENPNLFLNVLFGKEKKANLHLFLNEEFETFEVKEKDYELINSFNDKFIIPKLYLNYKSNSTEYYMNLYNFLEKAYNDFENDQMNSNKEENETIQNNDNSHKGNNDINSKNDDKKSIILEIDNEFQKKIKKYSNYFHERILHYFSYFLKLKYKINEEQLKFCEKACLLFLYISKNPYNNIIQFNSFKNEFFNNNKFTCYDKLKIIISLKTFLFSRNRGTSFLKLIEYNKLNKNSPFIQGYIFYKSIIEGLKLDSFITFIYNQINSGSGYDYIDEIECYKLKYIPLSIIKSHLLLNENDNKYFFIYSLNDGAHAFTDGYSKDTFFNLNSLDFLESNVFDSCDLENDSTKIGLLYFHENCHIKFRVFDSFNINSPQGLIKPDFKIFENNYIENIYTENDILTVEKSGESGRALEYFLFNENDAIDKLLECRDIKDLKNVDLFIQKNNENLVIIKDKIIKNNYRLDLGPNIKYLEYNTLSSKKDIKKIKKKKDIYDSMILV